MQDRHSERSARAGVGRVLALALCLALAWPVGMSRGQGELPADVEFDVLKLRLQSAVGAAQHREVLAIIGRMRTTGFELPADVPFLAARSHYALGDTARAREGLVAYLKSTGRKGKHYDEAVRLYVTVDQELKAAAEREREIASLRAHWQEARAAWLVERSRAEEWTRRAVVFGGPGDDIASALARTPDGGFVLAGAFHLQRGKGDKKIDSTLPWITAFDRGGRRIWHRPLGDASEDGVLRSAALIGEGGFLFGGIQKGFQIVAVTGPNGNLLNNHEGDPWIIGFAPATGGAGSVARVLGSGDIIGVGTEQVSRGGQKLRLPVSVRLSPDGKLVRKSVHGRVGGPLWYDIHDAKVLSGGDVIVAGETRIKDDDPLTAQGYLLRLAADGRELWARQVPASRGRGLTLAAVTETRDGGILAVGRDDDSLAYFKVEADGGIAWRRLWNPDRSLPEAITAICSREDAGALLAEAFKDRPESEIARSLPIDLAGFRGWACRKGKPFASGTAVARRADGYLLLGVRGWESSSDTRITLTAIDEEGAVRWERSLGYGAGNLPATVLATEDGGFIAAGMTSDWGQDVVLFKVDRQGQLAAFERLGPPPPPPAVAPKDGAPKETPEGAKESREPEAEVEAEAPAKAAGPQAETKPAETPTAPEAEAEAGSEAQPPASEPAVPADSESAGETAPASPPATAAAEGEGTDRAARPEPAAEDEAGADGPGSASAEEGAADGTGSEDSGASGPTADSGSGGGDGASISLGDLLDQLFQGDPEPDSRRGN